jgi:AcrR family transcriptional regulator
MEQQPVDSPTHWILMRTSKATDMSTSDEGEPRRGRPRVHDDSVILEAAVALMSELGYQRMSMQDIAKRSGVSVPSIYRRWSNKAEVASAAVASVRRARPEPKGDLRADLIAQLRDVRWMYANISDIGMAGTLLSEERRHPEFIDAWRRTVVNPRRRAVEGVIAEGQRRGLVAADVDPAAASQLLLGAYYASRIAGSPMDDAWDERVIDTLLSGILSH